MVHVCWIKSNKLILNDNSTMLKIGMLRTLIHIINVHISIDMIFPKKKNTKKNIKQNERIFNTPLKRGGKWHQMARIK